MKRHVLSVCVVLGLAVVPAGAQTANSTPAAGFGGAGGPGASGDVSRTAPSGGTAKPAPGTPQIGPETPVEKKAEEQAKKDTGICKGC